MENTCLVAEDKETEDSVLPESEISEWKSSWHDEYMK